VITLLGDSPARWHFFANGAAAFAVGGTTPYNLTCPSLRLFNSLSVASGVTLTRRRADNASLSGTLVNQGVIRKSKSVPGTGGSALA